MKRLIGIVICLCLVMTCTCSSFAIIHTSLNVKVDPLDYSYTLSVSATNPDGGDLSYQWYECNSSGGGASPVSGATGSVFYPDVVKETKYYFCQVVSEDEDGNVEFANTEVTQITDKSSAKEDDSDKDKDKDEDEDKDQDKSDKKEILTFSVDSIDEPETGETPDGTASIVSSSNPGYKIKSISWNPDDEEFKGDTAYTVIITVSILDGYEAGDGYKCLINGQKAKVSGNPENGEFSFSYTFLKTEEEETVIKPETITPEESDSGSSFGLLSLLLILFIIAVILTVIVFLVTRSRSKKEAQAEALRRQQDEYSRQNSRGNGDQNNIRNRGPVLHSDRNPVRDTEAATPRQDRTTGIYKGSRTDADSPAPRQNEEISTLKDEDVFGKDPFGFDFNAPASGSDPEPEQPPKPETKPDNPVDNNNISYYEGSQSSSSDFWRTGNNSDDAE